MFWRKQTERNLEFILEFIKLITELSVANDILEEKLNLILEHLELQYVPEKETTEGARLEKKIPTLDLGNITAGDCIAYDPANDLFLGDKPKKKRKYTKSGKFSKK